VPVLIRKGAWFSLLLFLCLSVSAESQPDCKFSLTEEAPRNIQFTVQAGRIAFLCKSDDFFLRGTVTRTLDWQLTGKIFEAMAESLKAETLDKWASGRLYRIQGDAKNQQRSLICGYHSREQYSIDICSPQIGENSEKAKALVLSLLTEFRKMQLDKSPLLKSAPLFAQKRVFTEENETREPALLALTMPAGYVEVTRRDNRALFTDAAGLAEMEVFYELSELALDSDLAHKVYRKSISSFLSRQGPWRPEREDNTVKNSHVACLLFTDNGTRLSHYCYVVAPVTIAGKKKFCRIAFVIAFAREAVDRDRLLGSQQAMLTGWAAILRKHSN
jgi:hypothetical protein